MAAAVPEYRAASLATNFKQHAHKMSAGAIDKFQ